MNTNVNYYNINRRNYFRPTYNHYGHSSQNFYPDSRRYRSSYDDRRVYSNDYDNNSYHCRDYRRYEDNRGYSSSNNHPQNSYSNSDPRTDSRPHGNQERSDFCQGSSQNSRKYSSHLHRTISIRLLLPTRQQMMKGYIPLKKRGLPPLNKRLTTPRFMNPVINTVLPNLRQRKRREKNE